MKTYSLSLLVAAAACVSLTAGCAASSLPRAADIESHQPTTELPSFQATTWEGDAARIAGKLQLKDDCASLVSANGDETHLVFTSMGSPTVTETSLTYDGTQYEIGSEVSFGGGEGIPGNVSIPAQCGGANQQWFTVSQQSTD